MPEPKPTPFPLRAMVAVVVGCALATGWLKPVYQLFVGRVFVPHWWSYLHLVSLAALLFLVFLLWKRDWKLSMLSLCAFVVSIVPAYIPDYVASA